MYKETIAQRGRNLARMAPGVREGGGFWGLSSSKHLLQPAGLCVGPRAELDMSPVLREAIPRVRDMQGSRMQGGLG